MTLQDQQKLIGLWAEFRAGRKPENPLFRSFYRDILLGLPGYCYGAYVECFDVLINGVADPDRFAQRMRAVQSAAADTGVSEAA